VETPETIANAYLARHGKVDIGAALSRGWELLQAHMGVLVGGTILAWLVSVGLSFVPILGWVVGFILLGSVDYMFLRRIRGEEVQIGDVFAGFNLAMVNLAMAGLVKALLVTIGLILCILPGIYLGVGYVFALPLVIDKKMDFWPAMEVSRRVVHAHWWSMFALVIVLAVVGFCGVLLCVVGLALTIPLASAALMYVYEDLFVERQQAVSESPMVTSPITAAP
jgi:hypothetical protein